MKRNTIPFVGVFLGLLVVALFHPRPLAQTISEKNPPLVISSLYGRDLFEFYCATCHGRDGKGSGPVESMIWVCAGFSAVATLISPDWRCSIVIGRVSEWYHDCVS